MASSLIEFSFFRFDVRDQSSPRGRENLRLAVLPRAGKQEVGADREPESVIAHDRNLDEHTQDRKDHR